MLAPLSTNKPSGATLLFLAPVTRSCQPDLKQSFLIDEDAPAHPKVIAAHRMGLNVALVMLLVFAFSILQPQKLGIYIYTNLRHNNFHGAIPDACEVGSKLKMIDMSQNLLEGPMPRSLTECTVLESLNLGNNQISDIFPFWLGALPELQVLILRANKFHGVIGRPGTDSEFPKLRIIDLSYNSFTGNLPSGYFLDWVAMKSIEADNFTYMPASLGFATRTYKLYDNYSYSMTMTMTMTNKGMERVYEKIPAIFRAIDFSSNKFKGEIPASIGSLKGLHLPNFSCNSLTGHISPSLRNLAELEALDLLQNNLSGEIPCQLTEMTFLGFFNVSHNNLTGLIPQGKQFDTFQNDPYEGNPGLCGNPLMRECKQISPQPSTSEQGQDLEPVDKLDRKAVVMGYGSGLLFGVIIGYTFIIRKYEWFMKKFGRGQQQKTGGKLISRY